MAVLFSAVLSDKAATERDFIQYWAAGRQLIQGGNPYDIAAILRLERAAGLEADKAMVSFSPPVALILAFPLELSQFPRFEKFGSNQKPAQNEEGIDAAGASAGPDL
jgi:hypothetical protein